MNVPFTLANSDPDKTFLIEAEQHGLLNLKGHRSVGGMRASIYNAMPPEGVDALIQFMKQFHVFNLPCLSITFRTHIFKFALFQHVQCLTCNLAPLQAIYPLLDSNF